MDVIEDAIDDFTYALEFYEEWRSALMRKKVNVDDFLSSSLDHNFFETTMKRHVSIAKHFVVELYNLFDLYIIEKYKSPFIVKRLGKKTKKLRFGERRYALAMDAKPEDVFPLFERLSGESLTKKQLEVINRMYDATVGVCRLLKFMDERKDDLPAEKGKEILIQMFKNGEPIQGIVTQSPYATSGKDIDDHLDVIDTCRNMSTLEVNFLNDVLFGLKIMLAKLKRMKSPYISSVQSVTIIGPVSKVPVDTENEVHVGGDPGAMDVAQNLPSASISSKSPEKSGIEEEVETGSGDAGISRMWDETCELKEPFCGPFSKYPEVCDIEESSNLAGSQEANQGQLTEVKMTSSPKYTRRCTIQ